MPYHVLNEGSVKFHEVPVKALLLYWSPRTDGIKCQREQYFKLHIDTRPQRNTQPTNLGKVHQQKGGKLLESCDVIPSQ